ncbi:MAG: hypothetical protein AAGE52_01415 [Myxococcota bacterium]
MRPPKVERPLREALRALTGAEPPSFVGDAYSVSELDESLWTRLQDWCSDHARPEWACGISMMDAADAIVSEAVANGNISRKPKLFRQNLGPDASVTCGVEDAGAGSTKEASNG